MIKVGPEGPSEDPGPPRALAWMPFAGVALAVMLLAAAHVLPRWPGLIQAVAPPPLDLAFDLRLLVARAPSYAVFLMGVIASLTVRSLVLASLLAAIGDRRPFADRLRSAGLVYATALGPFGLAAGLEFSGLAAVYAWYAWAGLALTLLVGLPLVRRAAGADRSTVLLWAVPALVALGAVARAGGAGASVALVPVSALLTATALRMMRRPPTTRAPAAVAALLILAPFLVPPVGGAVASQVPAGVLLLVPGVDTSSGRGAMYRFGPARLGYGCDRVFYYSYRGPGPGADRGEAACPIVEHSPYVRGDTQRPLVELVDAFARQVRRIRRVTERAPIAVVTHSQGAVIAWEAVATGRAEGISHVVALAGFPHAPVGYPPPGRDGAGRIGADVLRALSAISRSRGWGTFSPDAPLAREVLARPDGLEEVFAAPLPAETRAGTVAAAADTIVAPEGLRIEDVPGITADETHVGVVGSAEAYAAVQAILGGGEIRGSTLLAGVLDAVVHAFMPPPSGA